MKMCKLCEFYSEMPTCDHKLTSIRGNAGVSSLLLEWQKADSAKWARINEKVKDYKFILKDNRYNYSGNTPDEVRADFESQYRKDIEEEFKGEWWLAFLLLIANRGLYRAETTLEAKERLLIKTDINDINNTVQAQSAHVSDFYNNALDANVDAAGLALINFMTEYLPGEEPYPISTAILDEQKKVGELRTSQIVNTQTVAMMNAATLVYYTRNYVTRFRIETNDPCPICEDLAGEEYSYSQTQEYQISIDKSQAVTGHAMESSQKFYSQNPWSGMIPVHVNCQCFWVMA